MTAGGGAGAGRLRLVIAAAAIVWAACGGSGEGGERAPGGASAPAAPAPEASPVHRPAQAAVQTLPAEDAAPAEDGRPAILDAELVAIYPHDPAAFTQGLIWFDGGLFESTGQYGRSTLRRVELESGRVTTRVELAPRLFGEGLARVERRLVQLTWRAGRALIYDLEGLSPVGERSYDGEGWGLCFDGERLVRSDGSDRLFFHVADSMAEIGSIRVLLDGVPLAGLNELECVEGSVWANVYTTDRIVRIDPASGAVTGILDVPGLLTPREAAAADVLNGIAYRGETGTFLVTGKLWPSLFELRVKER